jgi:hypothetical protein
VKSNVTETLALLRSLDERAVSTLWKAQAIDEFVEFMCKLAVV